MIIHADDKGNLGQMSNYCLKKKKIIADSLTLYSIDTHFDASTIHSF